MSRSLSRKERHRVVALFGCCAALPMILMLAAAAEEHEAGSATHVFIGERISIEPLPDPCTEEAERTGELTCISLDSLFRANYRVVQPVTGGVAGEVVEFSVADHYGFPRFGRYRHALLFVGNSGEEGNWLHKYQAIPLQRTEAGGWATCGDLKYETDEKSLVAEAQSMVFPGPWIVLADLPEYERELMLGMAAHAPDTYRLDDGQVYCLEGVPVEEAYRIVRDGVMSARGVPLPPWPTGL